MRSAESSASSLARLATVHISVLSLHTSPAAQPGQGDAGGMNVYVDHTVRALAAMGHVVDVFTADPNGNGTEQPDAETVTLSENIRLHFLRTDATTKEALAGRIDDKATTSTAIDAAKTMFNTYPDINAVIGLDSSSGTGICLAAEELEKDIADLTVIVHDREDPVLECIQDGVIDASIVNKTALQAFMAVQMLEAYNDQKIGLANVPISADNKAAGVNPFPAQIYMGTEVIDGENVGQFTRANLPKY